MSIPVRFQSCWPTAWLLLVSYSRIRGEQHFPSDVFVGSILGSLIAQQVYSRHHDPELGGDDWRSIGELFRDSRTLPQNQGSPYVPLDSWVYPALDRLAAFGLVDSEFAGMRPWTRRECARLVSEAEDRLADMDVDNSNQEALVNELEREFRPEIDSSDGGENATFRVESLYSRTEYISGTPLRDGYHFAQTQINDFGRPYGKGWNTVTGFSTYATEGRWMAYFRGEWQASAGLPALSLTARQTIQQVDHLLTPAAGHWPAFGKSVPGAGCLCRSDVFELAGLVWPSEPVVGAGGRRPADFQRQCRAAQHVSH